MKAFGIGCLHFAIDDVKSEKKITVSQYVDEVKKVLEEFSTVSEIVISYNEDMCDEEIAISLKSPKLNNGESCYPFLDFYSLEFNIYIPFLLQAKAIKRNENILDTYTENFRVTIRHNWHGPISYIECINPTVNTEPSTAVQIIRNYLSDEVKNIQTFLTTDFIGPTPFHANFYLLVAGEDERDTDNQFKLDFIKQAGYDKLYFKYNPILIKSEEEALESLFIELEDEIAFFYKVKIKQVRNIRNWSDIQEDMHAILEYEDNKIKRSVFDKLFKRPKLLKQVFKNIGLFKGQSIFDKSFQDTDYANIYTHSGADTYLKSLIDKEISESTTYPVTETIDLLTYFDQKSSKMFELTVVFITTIIGGIVGAVITLAFS
jgi:hypothetical protein